MRAIPLVLALCATLVLAAEEAPAPAPAADPKAQAKELEMKLKVVREEAVKADAELGKLKSESDDARKRFETAVEARLKDNADYQALKAQLAELRGKKKDGEKKKDK